MQPEEEEEEEEKGGKKTTNKEKEREKARWGLGGCETVKNGGDDSEQEAEQARRQERLELEEDEGRREISPITADNSR